MAATAELKPATKVAAMGRSYRGRWVDNGEASSISGTCRSSMLESFVFVGAAHGRDSGVEASHQVAAMGRSYRGRWVDNGEASSISGTCRSSMLESFVFVGAAHGRDS